MVMHAGDYCSPFCLAPFHQTGMALLGVFGRNDGDRETLSAYAARGMGTEIYESPHSFDVGGKRVLLVHDIAEISARSIESHDFVIHGSSHLQSREEGRKHTRRESGRSMRLDTREMHGGDSRHRDRRGGTHHSMTSRILIIDFGSQFTQLIARRVREARVYSEIHPPSRTVEWIREWKPTGIILSGGPNSVYGENVPLADPAVLDIAPVLGICYGMQLIAHIEGGQVIRTDRREYGRAEMKVLEPDRPVRRVLDERACTAWMSHGDHIEQPPSGYQVTAESNGNPISAFRHDEARSTACSSIPRSRTRRAAAR